MDERVVHDRDLGDEDQDRVVGSGERDLSDPLGIAQTPVASDSRIRASADPDEVRQRRRRVSADLNSRTTDGLGDLDDDPFGAKGIDMGGAGDGTDRKAP